MYSRQAFVWNCCTHLHVYVYSNCFRSLYKTNLLFLLICISRNIIDNQVRIAQHRIAHRTHSSKYQKYRRRHAVCETISFKYANSCLTVSIRTFLSLFYWNIGYCLIIFRYHHLMDSWLYSRLYVIRLDSITKYMWRTGVGRHLFDVVNPSCCRKLPNFLLPSVKKLFSF